MKKWIIWIVIIAVIVAAVVIFGKKGKNQQPVDKTVKSIEVEKGDLVDFRQLIGTVGSSGRSTGPHLHYEVRLDERPLDPDNFLEAGRHLFKG